MSKSDLVDRYLNAVKPWLPRKQQKDILAELAEDLQSQIEDRESALGHPLDEEELVAVLKQRGSPMRVASSFIPEHRIIDPAMLPLYRLALKIVLLWVMLPMFAITLIVPIFDSHFAFARLLAVSGTAVQSFFFAIGIVTAAFALMDQFQAKWVDRWDPRKLPRVPAMPQNMQWYNDFSGFAFGAAGAIFWASMMWHRTAFVYPGSLRLEVGAIWGQLYWAILGVTLVRALVDLYCFIRRNWTPSGSWARIVLDLAGIAVEAVVLKAGHWAEIGGPHLTPADAAKLLSALNGVIQVCLVFAMVVAAVDMVKQLRLLFRRHPHASTPALTLS